jgi:putative ABC transport system substrate-binding protein
MQFDRMKRREFITLLGTTAAWPLAARAQEPGRMRRIGVLLGGGADNADAQANVAAFLQALEKLGWIDGRNVQIDYRSPAGDADKARKYAAELVALAPDVILSSGNANLGPLLQATRAVPIVFNNVADPVGAGFVNSLARPGGNATGFVQFEYSLSGKWLELLKQIAPSVTRVAVLRDPAISSGVGQFAVIQSVAPSLGVEISTVNLYNAGEKRAITAFAGSSNGGLILTASALSVVHRDLIITLAAQHKLPAVYYRRYFVTGGGLISLGMIFSTSSGARPATSNRLPALAQSYNISTHGGAHVRPSYPRDYSDRHCIRCLVH